MLEIVAFLTIINSLPLLIFIKKECNEIYSLFAAIPAKEIVLMIENFKKMVAKSDIAIK